MKCLICGKDMYHTEDHMEHILLESHDLCPDKHCWYDWVTGHGTHGFCVTDTVYVDYINEDGGVLFTPNDEDVFDEISNLTSVEVFTLFQAAKILYDKMKG